MAGVAMPTMPSVEFPGLVELLKHDRLIMGEEASVAAPKKYPDELRARAGANRTNCVYHVMAYECCKHVKSGDRDGGLRLSVLAHADVRRWSA